MKKQFIQPSMKTYIVKTESLLDNVSYGGSNRAAGAPTEAESKGFFGDDWD